MNGSSLITPDGQRHVTYAFVTQDAILEAVPFPSGQALRRQNLYYHNTNSKYASLITHTHSVLWQERGFLTTKGIPIINEPLISKQLEALSFPTEVAIVHYRGHQTSKDLVSRDNNKTDSTA
ncbi:unnamed protein product [Nyctereutes procyonoides]|uniref:(raccoon dog) hypothetical protein n=1 Tax=Nyctereutes procyonoides TaxID=34880 RepID=A0A811ZN60_NYCPR|nr:unnamed protein product [Nyctereutes procyonoides]